jgi:hypothetical protein
MASLLLGQLLLGGFPILEADIGYMATKPALKSIRTLTLFCHQEETMSFQIPSTSFYTFRFGYALVYRFIGCALEDGSYDM